MSSPALRVGINRIDRVVVVSADGEVDIATAPILRTELNRQVDGDLDALVLDLCNVGFMDSSGLGVVIGVVNRTSSRGIRFSVVCPVAKLRRIFEITGVASRLEMMDSLDDALSASA